jgi:hypothetical protein
MARSSMAAVAVAAGTSFQAHRARTVRRPSSRSLTSSGGSVSTAGSEACAGQTNKSRSRSQSRMKPPCTADMPRKIRMTKSDQPPWADFSRAFTIMSPPSA